MLAAIKRQKCINAHPNKSINAYTLTGDHTLALENNLLNIPWPTCMANLTCL